MIRASFTQYNDDIFQGVITETFNNEGDMYLWLNQQSGHPWISYQIAKVEHLEMPYQRPEVMIDAFNAWWKDNEDYYHLNIERDEAFRIYKAGYEAKK